MKLEVIESLTLYRDNKMSIALTKNIEIQHCTKYIDFQHHYIRKLINKRELTIEWIPGSRILIDEMTKAFPIETFKKHQSLWGLSVKWRERESKKSLN